MILQKRENIGNQLTRLPDECHDIDNLWFIKSSADNTIKRPGIFEFRILYLVSKSHNFHRSCEQEIAYD